MSNTLYEIDNITIDLESLIDNSLSVDIDIALFRDKIFYRCPGKYIIEIPFIKGTNYFFSVDFDMYNSNQCDIDTLLMMGLLRTMSSNTRKLVDKALSMNSIARNM